MTSVRVRLPFLSKLALVTGVVGILFDTVTSPSLSALVP